MRAGAAAIGCAGGDARGLRLFRGAAPRLRLRRFKGPALAAAPAAAPAPPHRTGPDRAPPAPRSRAAGAGPRSRPRRRAACAPTGTGADRALPGGSDLLKDQDICSPLPSQRAEGVFKPGSGERGSSRRRLLSDGSLNVSVAERGSPSSPEGKMAQDMTEKELLKMELDQLKKEVKNERQMVSKTGKEIKEYIESMAGEDPLLKGIPEDKNPFKEKGGCTIS
ncbi:phosphoethanolamine/phosphocholine phosphatase isoform X3 [Calonectris borealis]|uniref:phosphoethanolamine/phosphocholine phosphatase isoform X3 n=1 Tax=Calonectris borealis TaxID=1323832 RepID=UPI003F4C0A60